MDFEKKVRETNKDLDTVEVDNLIFAWNESVNTLFSDPNSDETREVLAPKLL